MEDCIFCKIVNGQLPSKNVYEDHISMAFHDISPQAPTHILVIPKKHIRSLVEAEQIDKELIGHLNMVARKIADDRGISAKGYRLVLNSGLEAGQSVWHIHYHLLAGRKFTWPPG